MSRDPSDAELNRNAAFLEEQRGYHSRRDSSSDADVDALTDLCQVMLNLNEFVYIN